MFHTGWTPAQLEVASLFTWLGDQYASPGHFAFVTIDALASPSARQVHTRYQIAETPAFLVIEDGYATEPIARRRRGGTGTWGNGAGVHERQYTTAELRTLMETVRQLSDIAWLAAHADAKAHAEASHARAYYQYLSAQRTQAQQMGLSQGLRPVGAAPVQARKAKTRRKTLKNVQKPVVAVEGGSQQGNVGRYQYEAPGMTRAELFASSEDEAMDADMDRISEALDMDEMGF